MTEYYLAIAVAILAIILTFLISKRFRKSLRVILLIGVSDAGKTAIFSRIVFNKIRKSVTSLKENEASVVDLNIKLVDLPGAERLRVRLWEQYRAKAQHIVYVVDSTNIDTKYRDVCAYLYQILADELVHKNRTRITIACHKQDLGQARDKVEIKSILEKELQAIKETKRGQLEKTSEEEENDCLIHEKEISLDSMSVDLIETSVHNLDQLIKLLL